MVKSLKRKPKQSRSVATVEAIVEAAAQILQRQSYQETTTNGIAEHAGVSIGSVYQYFRNKSDIYQAVLDRYFSRLVADITAEAIPVDADIDAIIEQLIYAAYSAAPEGPELLRKIRQVPDAHFHEKLEGTKHQIVEFMRAIIVARPEVLNVEDLEFSLRLLIDAIEGIFINLPEGHPPETLAKEMTRLITRYLFVAQNAHPHTGRYGHD